MGQFLTIYKASAGSGKTFTLTFNYLKLLLSSSDPFQYQKILAITFTNKATQEMKSRIIESLHLLATGGKTEYLEMLEKDLELDRKEIVKRATRSLSNILHDYSHFSVSTIDAFVQRVIRSFSRELGHRGNYGIEMDVAGVMDTLVRRQISKTGKDKFLTDWINDLIRDRIRDSKSIRITKMLKELGQELFSEQYMLLTQDDTKEIEEETFATVKGKLLHIVTDFEENIHQIGKEAEDQARSRGFELSDFNYGKSGGAMYLNKIQKPVNKTDDYEPGTRALTAIDNYESLVKKTELKNSEKVGIAEQVISPAIKKAIQFKELEFPKYVTATLILRSLHAFGLIHRLEAALSDYREEEEVMMISDASQLLNEIVTKTHAPFIYEKIGTRYDHYLIDEFQDTSTLQWQNLEPLVSDSIASGRQNLLVGDVKQSIYRFRGGNWRLMHEHLNRQFELTANTINLESNYRSKKEIIDFNNAVFPKLSKLLSSSLSSQISGYISDQSIIEEVESIDEIYKDVAQLWSGKESKSGGYVEVQLIEGRSGGFGESDYEEDAKFEEIVLNKIPELLESLQDKGIDLSDVAFLVKTKSQGNKIADFLRRFENSPEAKPDYSYKAASSEAFKLSESACLNVFFYLLKWLLYEKDTFSLYRAVYNWKSRLNNEDPGIMMDEIKRESLIDDLKKKLPADFINDYHNWLHNDLYSLFQEFKRVFELDKYPGEFAYISTFEDELLNFIQRRYSLSGLGAIQAICEWWDERGGEIKIDGSSSPGAANILTIHKSKGLEFRIVIIPFLIGEFQSASGFIKNYLWLNSLPEIPQDLPFYPFEISSRLKESLYAKDYAEESILSYIDTFNTVYVALTRAEEGLYIFSEQSIPKSGEIKRIEHLVSRLFEEFPEQLPGEFDVENKIYRQGELKSYPEKPAGYSGSYLNPLPVSTWNNKLLIRQSRALVFEKSEEKLERINLGIAAHNFLARLENLNEVDSQLEEFANETGLRSEEYIKIKEMVSGALSNQQIRSWFDSNKRILSERPLILTNGSQVRPDKLLFDDEKNEVEIIDFKTGEEKSEDENQVRKYASYLENAGYKVAGISLCYIGEGVKIKEVK
ncbi:UvrD-helicase domain-containing protein [Marinigracilibium pacificum]|uniref:UvrD-helicase domain-containing protein n=1 Tax=Marinigracilibium pacificum TaxID=2729599 RepID=A0A848J442_9BACT|nr:UvrD-helicase domain-containing protein [Marinigracilibium pacificum]NMM49119.1 UvrD-helicase domain-containing protein [Marinigracilibium pacificum]